MFMMSPLQPILLKDAVGDDKTRLIAGEALKELQRATSIHGPMRGTHEGYAVMLEEFDELWDEIKKKHPDKEKLREEAIQIAAMAMRFVLDVCKP